MVWIFYNLDILRFGCFAAWTFYGLNISQLEYFQLRYFMAFNVYIQRSSKPAMRKPRLQTDGFGAESQGKNLE
jgi:hypothetical protein